MGREDEERTKGKERKEKGTQCEEKKFLTQDNTKKENLKGDEVNDKERIQMKKEILNYDSTILQLIHLF